MCALIGEVRAVILSDMFSYNTVYVAKCGSKSLGATLAASYATRRSESWALSDWLFLSKWAEPRIHVLVEFQNNFTEMILGWTSTNVVQTIMLCQKTWPPEAGPVFLIWLYRNLWKSCSSPKLIITNNFTAMILGWTSTKFVKRIMICQKTRPLGPVPVFLIHLYHTDFYAPSLKKWGAYRFAFVRPSFRLYVPKSLCRVYL
jgi:hypothetical protein